MTSLAKLLSTNGLHTDLGYFEFISLIGQGGNGTVAKMRKGNTLFAAKFLAGDPSSKLARFKDEYLCTLLLPQSRYIVRPYHFDVVNLDGHTYAVIVMKLYDDVLSKMQCVSDHEEEVRAARAKALFVDISKGLKHLHTNNTIHRDVKPENIFFDKSRNLFVIGDLGIAHFSGDSFPREAKTKDGERIANYAFSPPEQALKGYRPVPNCDIYALGQVLSWHIFGTTVRGSGRRAYVGGNDVLKMIDQIIDRCVRNDPSDRFQTIDEIYSFATSYSERPRDPWAKLHDFDDAIRSSLPKIDEIYQTENHNEIVRFLSAFAEQCRLEEFWFDILGQGDNAVRSLIHLHDDRWLLHGEYELRVSKLACYRHRGCYKSLFVLFTEADGPFDLCDFEGNSLDRPVPATWSVDTAVLHKGVYTDPRESMNGYYEAAGKVHALGVHEHRTRLLEAGACLFSPQGSGPASTPERQHVEKFLRHTLQKKELTKKNLAELLDATDNYIQTEYWAMA